MRDIAIKPETPLGSAKTTVREAMKRQLNVMHAVILRDIRSRFFNHGLGFLVTPLFPVAHIGVLLTVYSVMGRGAVFGEDLKLYFATGLVPVLTLNYISRFMATSLMTNKNMLAFPAVHLMDIVLARSVLEFLAIVISIFAIIVILLCFGTDPFPYDPAQAAMCIGVTALLAVGVGTIVSVISAIYPFFSLGYALFTVLVYLTSGAPIYLEGLPEKYLNMLSYNPSFQIVTWMRSSYYVGYPTAYLDKIYLLLWALCSISLGLLMERMLRRTVLNGG